MTKLTQVKRVCAKTIVLCAKTSFASRKKAQVYATLYAIGHASSPPLGTRRRKGAGMRMGLHTGVGPAAKIADEHSGL